MQNGLSNWKFVNYMKNKLYTLHAPSSEATMNNKFETGSWPALKYYSSIMKTQINESNRKCQVLYLLNIKHECQHSATVICISDDKKEWWASAVRREIPTCAQPWEPAGSHQTYTRQGQSPAGRPIPEPGRRARCVPAHYPASASHTACWNLPQSPPAHSHHLQAYMRALI